MKWTFAMPTGHAFKAAALFVAAVLGVAVLTLMNLSANSDLQAELNLKSETLDTLKRRGVPNLSDARVNPANKLAFIPAATETIAASTLQQYILDQLEKADGTVQSIQAEPSREASNDGYRRLNTQIAFESSIDQLQRLLFELETGTPFVFVDSLSVQPVNSPAQGARIGDRLRVTLIASSYWQSQPEGAPR